MVKTTKQGKAPEEFWPWNITLRCYRCGWEGKPERGVDEGHIKVEQYETGAQWDTYMAEHRVFVIVCPCCGRDVREIEH